MEKQNLLEFKQTCQNHIQLQQKEIENLTNNITNLKEQFEMEHATVLGKIMKNFQGLNKQNTNSSIYIILDKEFLFDYSL